MNSSSIASLLASLLVVPSPTSAAEESGSADPDGDRKSWETDSLTGDRGGDRSQRYASGVNVEFMDQLDYPSATS